MPKERFEAIDGVLATVDEDAVGATVATLERDPRVLYAEPNFLFYADEHGGHPSDPAFHDLWALDNFGQVVNEVAGVRDADIDAREAWGVTTGRRSVVVAVIDSGIDSTHPDLGGAATASSGVWLNPGENCAGCRANGVDDDGNGYVDDWRGWDFLNDDNDPADDNGHGTHVAGTIGASGDDGVGVVGVNWSVTLLALKFLGAEGTGSAADAVRALLYASAKGADIVNASWGSERFSQALLDAIEQAGRRGSLFVAAAGNGNVDTDASPRYPAAYDAPSVLSVAATDAADTKAPFSNYGRRTIDLGAPGVNILSTARGGLYRYASGTSMATAHASGAAALVKARFPRSSGLGIKALLLNTVDPNASLAGRSASEGRVNVDRAVRCGGTPTLAVEMPADGFLVEVGAPIAVSALAATCADPRASRLTASGNGQSIVLASRGDGLYTGTHAPPTAGPITITLRAVGSRGTVTRTVTGRAVQNYRIEEAPFAWIDATVGGTNAGIAEDDGTVTVPLPFRFDFYGESFTSVHVSANGHVVFGPSRSHFTNTPVPNPNAPNGVVAPLWDDLNPAQGGSIWYRTTGVPPARRFVVAWVGVPRFHKTGDATFEVVLDEATGDILFQYEDVSFGESGYDYGASATVGVEDVTGTIGRQFSYNRPSLAPYERTKAIRFTTQAARPGP
ncbi:MAG: S8 family serine peptidase [Actinomycetota bacterium]|nr:S8 family serine peptidase [Actinomycetota bacterium]